VLPWGDVTKKGNKLFLAVYHWPANGHLFLPGLKNEILAAKLLGPSKSRTIAFKKTGTWTDLTLPAQSPEKFIPVIELTLKGNPEVDTTQGIDPSMETTIPADFAKVEGCTKNSRKWMEKFGEWKHIVQINKWTENSKASWEVEVMNSGTYLVELSWSGNGRMVWSVETDEGTKIKNQQNSSTIYTTLPIGWLNFSKPGKHTLSVTLKEGDFEKANLTAVKISPVEF
jgi:alpha-L-fucosidase